MQDELMSHPLKNEQGNALLQTLFYSVIIGAVSYAAFSFLSQYQKNSAKIIDRSKYSEIGASKIQTFGDPSVATSASQYHLDDIAE